VGASVSHAEQGMQLLPLVFVPQIMFCGFFVPVDEIPVYLRWAQYVCALKYGLNLIVIEELKRVPKTWPAGAPVALYNNAVHGCPVVDGDFVCFPASAPIDPDAMLPRNEMYPAQVGTYCGVLIAIFVLFRSAALLVLKAKARS
jgi:hypothetical protein